jgi:hypothetical protein
MRVLLIEDDHDTAAYVAKGLAESGHVVDRAADDTRYLPPRRLLRSSTFRLALAYMGLFGASVLVLLAYIYWFTVAYTTAQADATVEAEVAGLAERYHRDGLAGLTALILERISRKPAGSAVYLLADEDLRPVVGNLDRWPANHRDVHNTAELASAVKHLPGDRPVPLLVQRGDATLFLALRNEAHG